MTYTQADLDTIDQAIKDFHLKGVAQITFGDQSTTFRSIDDLLKMRAFVANALASTRKHRVAASRKGV